MIVDWGDDTYSQLFYPFININATQVSTGYEHTLAIIDSASVTAWGNGTYGQLSVPSGITNPVKVAAGLGHSLVLQQDGLVKGWGFNDYGQVNVGSLSNVVDIAAGDEHSVVVFADGTVQVIANGSTTYNLTPPGGLTNVRAVASGNFHILALKSDSTVVAWGSNEFGQSDVPAGLNGVVAVSAGQFHSIALLENGTVVGWGDNVLFDQITIPTGLSNATKIETGNFHSLALNSSNTFYSWGSDRFAEGVIPNVLKNRTIHDFTAGFAHNTLIVSNKQPSMSPQSDIIYVDENIPASSTIAILSASDPDTQDGQKFSLVSGAGSTDNGSFEIFPLVEPDNITNDIFWGLFPQTTLLLNLVNFNYEADSIYSIRLQVTDLGGLTDAKPVIVKIRNVNEDVLSLDLDSQSVEEKRPIGTAVGNFESTDIDLFDSHTYNLVPGSGSADNGSFFITGTTLYTDEVFLYESKSAYEIRVRSTDKGGLNHEDKFIVRIIPVNFPPTDILISEDTVKENVPIGTLVGFFTTIDADTLDNFTYSFANGSGDSDNSSFLINSNALLTNTEFKYDLKNEYFIRVKSTDDGKPENLSIEKEFIIRIISQNQSPAMADQEFTIPEDTPPGTPIGSLAAVDDGSLTFSIFSGNTGNAFVLDPTTGIVSVNGQLEFDDQPDYFLTVQVEDEFGKMAQATVTIHLQEVKVFPMVSDQTFEISEDSPNGSSVGFFQATGKNSLRFAIISGHEDGMFSIVPETGEIEVSDNTDLNAITNPIYALVIWAFDGVEETEATASAYIVVTDANYAPASISLDKQSILEQQVRGTEVGDLSTLDRDPGDQHTYTLESGTDHFRISGNTLLSTQIFDYKIASEYTITVRSTDNGTPSKFIETNFTISIIPLELPLIPQAITPNGDGANDRWEIENLELYPKSHVEVFDRSGQRVFSSTGYPVPWDGTFQGSTLPLASYYYVIRLNNPVGTTYTGTVTVLRE